MDGHAETDFDEEEREIGRQLDALWDSSAGQNVVPSNVTHDGTELVADRYQLEHCIGSGAFGLVYRAFDTVGGKHVAIKLPRPEVLLAPQQLERFRREAAIAMQLAHDGIIPVIDCNFEVLTPFIVMHWCDGPDLAQFMQRAKVGDQRIEWKSIAMTVAKVARAIDHAHHQGITHRDLKPSNILLEPLQQIRSNERASENLEDYEPRVTDFGLAHLVDASVTNTRSSILIGTPVYLAPEQIERFAGQKGESKGSSCSDIYALGMILFELLAGKPAVEGDSWFSVIDSIRNGRRLSLKEIRPDLPPNLIAICECCLSRDPAGRYETAALFAEDLEACCMDRSVTLAKRSWRQRFSFFSQQQQRVSQAGTFALMLQFLVMLCFAGTLMAKLLGVPIRGQQSVAYFLVEWLFVAITIHIPIGWVAIKTLKGQRSAVWAGLLGTALLVAVQLVVLLGIISGWWPLESIPVYADEPATARVVYIIMMAAFSIQTFLFAIAVPASRRFGN